MVTLISMFPLIVGAHAAVLSQHSIMDGVEVCVLGAGIVGLTTAVLLQKIFSNVTILAEKFTTETTSDGAAGLFCPFSSFHAATYQTTRDIVKDSYQYYKNLWNTFGETETGIMESSGFILSNINADEVKNPLIENVVPDYRILSETELKDCPGEWKYGSYFKTFIIQGRIYLPWVLKMFQNNGGKIIQKRLLNFEDLISYDFDVIVNCTGIGAKELCHDTQLVPMRGQVIKVSAPWIKNFYLLDNDVYIIPGKETTLGGCRQYGNYDLNVDKYISAQIWENCTKILPSLKESAIIRDWAGLRPYRVPIRLEAEEKVINGKIMKIIHNYGHGAQGVTTAPGTAKIATELTLQIVKEKSKLKIESW